MPEPPPTACAGFETPPPTHHGDAAPRAAPRDVDLRLRPVQDYSVLGRGGLGIVYKQWSDTLNAYVAVKYLRTVDDNEKRNVQEEVDALRKLSGHPNVVQIFGFQQLADEAVIQMELLQGSLVDVVKRHGMLTEAESRARIRDALKGLQAVHVAKLVHRDIKPANLLCTSDDCVKLADFGIVRNNNLRDSNTGPGKGTPYFIAPEAHADDPLYEAAGDVWGLACTWLFLVTGRLPWDGVFPLREDEFTVAVRNNRRLRPLTPGHLSSEAKELLKKMLERDPSKRPSATDLLRDPYFTRENLPDDAETPQGFASRKQREFQWVNARADQQQRPENGSFWQTVQLVDMDLSLRGLVWQKNEMLYRALLPQHDPNSRFKPWLDTMLRQSDKLGCLTISRAFAVQHSRVNAFLEHHLAESDARDANVQMRPENPTDTESQAALNKLKSYFADEYGLARIVFVWYGTDAKSLEATCRDGPRALNETEPGRFGEGAYFSFEAAYAAQRSRRHAPNADGEFGIILFAVSISRAMPITLERHYREPARDLDPELQGFSKFYSPDPETPISLTRGCDAHFVPVRRYGTFHPRDPTNTLDHDVGFQACPEGDAEAHEIVIREHQRCTPVAIVYFK